MSLIKKSNELVIPTTVKMMIYGQAGMGKSTVALSALYRSLHGVMFNRSCRRICLFIRPL